ncbi:MAG TPA: MATE family efflux transporter [Oscillospiraceae bacterium]|nr:MATE family efflux transporter [Oscillospiraceae bacterium]HNW04393.1 MATE family efflux transporter [Oscillospiraceae bacterium]
MENTDKFYHMTHDPVEKLVARLAVPTILTMLVTNLYNMADTFFVGKIGTSATGAVGIAYSFQALVQAIGFFFGQGAGNYISRKLGEQDREEASHMASTGFFLSFGFGVALAVLGVVFLEPLAVLLGSTETILPYAKDYLRYILYGVPFMASSLVLNNELRFQGSAVYAMAGMVSGAALNVGLDPLFIFTFHMGTGGAALATTLSQIVSFSILLVGCTRGGNLRVRLRDVRLKGRYFAEIVRGGLPSFCRQALAATATAALNTSAGLYGDAAVAAMSVVTKVMGFALASVLGFGQGFQPVCGFNYGAGLYKRVRRAFWFCVKVSAGVLAVLSMAGVLFAPQIIGLFRDDPAVIAFGARALRFQCATFTLISWVVICNMLLQNIGRAVEATFLALARQGLFFIPVILIMPGLFGESGIQVSQSIADVITFCCSLPMGLAVLKSLKGGGKDG